MRESFRQKLVLFFLFAILFVYNSHLFSYPFKSFFFILSFVTLIVIGLSYVFEYLSK